jgi:hypothetical protein
MEFTNEIFFNKKLTANETVIITYCGKLYREHSQEISIVYGFGDNWEFTSETQMKEIENGFEVTLTMKDFNTFNFCFKNDYGIWDNNSGFNYISSIEPQKFQTDITLDSPSTDGNSIQENTSSVQEQVDQPETEEESDEEYPEENSSNETTTAENFTNNSQDDIETVFSSLLDSILNNVKSDSETINVDEMEGFGLQSVDEIKEENFVSCDEIFNEFYKELATVPSPNNTNLELNQTLENEDDLEVLFDRLFSATSQSAQENIQKATSKGGQKLVELLDKDKNEDNENSTSLSDLDVNFEQYSAEELDTLMDNILKSITSDDTSSIELSSPIQQTEETLKNDQYQEAVSTDTLAQPETTSETDELSGLPTVSSQGDWFERVLDSSYAFIKKVSVVCKKIGTLIKSKAQEYGIIKEK